ncbi:hypothetical protein LOTGIDRAFT_154408 [Lottia gigantea]|uniref:Methyltransferase type 11 domain-containing protein n=1 Tax=Lottia gigantea TaxID=225164 RepID=V3ZDW2_LOTGI|nr:hypothetical protein LOTGIDRAFT_154408 [Lottia gigantea]ESO89308.1 hypothetical protein LOTGIDRAFT_154408 [Lottia gigantea]
MTKHSRQRTQNVKYEILELGAGTGKFTKKLKDKLKQEKLIAGEPSEGFLTVLKQSCPDVECLQFAANNIPLPDSSVKAVVCAQAFHWFANVPSLSEIDRVLVPGGLLFLVYNRKDRRYPMVSELSQKIESFMGDKPPPQYSDMKWKNVFNETGSLKRHQDIILDGIKFKGPLDVVINNACSVSYINNLPDDMKVKVKQEIAEIIKSYVGDQAEIHIPHYSIIHLYRKQQ